MSNSTLMLHEYALVFASIGGSAFLYNILNVKKTKTKKVENLKKVKEDVKIENIDGEVIEIENIVDDLYNIIELNDLKLKFKEFKRTTNTIKIYFSTYSENEKVIRDGKERIKKNFTKMKEITSLSCDFERVTNEKLEITTEKSNIVFVLPRNPEFKEILNYIDFYDKVSKKEMREKYRLPIIFGIDENSEIIVEDLTEMRHLLGAGTTGSGKSVFVNSAICGLLKTLSNKELNFAMIDPKNGVELGCYDKLESKGYLFDKIAKKSDESIELIKKVHSEMEFRYKIMSENNVRDIRDLHSLGIEIPYLVMVIDEFANIMITQKGKEKEKFTDLVASIAQMGRACGIHIMLFTQRPSVDVVTGTIKSVLPARIAFSLPTLIDSKTILDAAGAEKLTGKGDGLYSINNSKSVRIQSCFLTDFDINKIINEV